MYPSPEERAKRLELKQIYQELRYLKLSYTDSLGKHILPDFAEKIYLLRELIESLDKLVQVPHNRGELFRSEDLLQYMVLQNLEDTIKERIDLISPENYLQRMESSEEQESAERQWESEWREITHHITELHHSGLNQKLFQIEILYALTEYDFKTLIAKFDPSFKRSEREKTPRFKECPREGVEQDLLDFYFIAGSIHLSQECRGLIEHLYAYYHEDRKNVNKLHEIYDRIEILFENDLSMLTLESLFKILHQNPGFKAERMKLERDYIDDVWQMVLKRYQKSTIFVQRRLLDRQSIEKMKSYFSEEILAQLPVYAPNSDEVFENADIYGFIYCLPMRLIKTYQNHYLAGEFLSFLMKLNFDGIFTDQEFKADFQTALEQLSEIGDHLHAFEAQRTDEQVFPAVLVSKMDELIQYRDELNREAWGILVFTAELLQKLNAQLRVILEEHRELHPHLVSNIKVIGGDQNRAMIAIVDKACELHSALLDIFRSYLENRYFPQQD